MPKLTPKNYAQALYDAVHETAAKDHDLVLDNFVKILAQNGDLGRYAEIETEYHLIEMEQKGIKQANVTVARDMEMNSGLLDQLNKIVGGKAELKKQVDSSLVGGVVIKIDDTLIDASIKTQLKNINNTLKQ